VLIGQNLVRNKCPTATFIWCSAHRLNLVVGKAVSCNNDAIDLFGNLELVYNFITGSKKRVAVYEDFQSKYSNTGQKRRLKRVSTTRWMSQDYALQAVLDTFDSVIYTLEQTKDTECRNDHSVGHLAGCLLNYLLSKRFIMTAISFKTVFDVLSPLNTILQSSDLDLFAAIHSISNAQSKINNLRQKDGVFESLMTKVNDFISDKEFIFSDLQDKRIHRKKKMPGENSNDCPIVCPVQKFKVETFFRCLDVLIINITEYFNTEMSGIYKDISLLTKKRIDEIKENPDSLPEDSFLIFCNIYSNFLNQDNLRNEYKQF